MLIIANNITTRNRNVANALKPARSGHMKKAQSCALFLGNVAKECVAAGASVLEINLQQRYDMPEVMEYAINAVQKGVHHQVCISSSRPDTLEAGLKACHRPPIVNYEQLLPLVARYNAEVVLLTADPVPPPTLEETIKSAAILVGAANEAGIPNSHILIDPGVLHIAYSVGQSHSRALLELIPALREAFDPPVRTTCWIDNVSTGAPRRLRPFINSSFLAMLSGLGLSSAFVDVLENQMARTMRLMRVFANELIYSDAEIDRRL